MLNDDVKSEVTQVLQAIGQNSRTSAELLPLVYNELRQLAAARMCQSAAQTLQATALVHEAWLRLFDGNLKVWQNRTHFFRAAAQAMRQILIDRARQKMSLKRGARPVYVSIDDVDIAEELPEERVLFIDEALQRLQKKDAELAQVVTLKFFAGLTNAEVAEMTGVTERTVQNKWTFAKAWLINDIEEELNRAQ
ncbi:ECF-type sigma factor [Pedosphaera parvula]|uniref:RNA polymerase, sigma-24 subunit, ECF subfamily n=1 Tax=Pedosphaera parvula (strain Ellin514) TaxID=320771 RepID=B9XAK3_PEDPL|nr:ECF-type sigma factor [Pedosphaera parvula]EEF63038.1 RNA polymerase, sigma-24 subunit, ECF subfamily [Pedosphaera parvula Ellin514]